MKVLKEYSELDSCTADNICFSERTGCFVVLILSVENFRTRQIMPVTPSAHTTNHSRITYLFEKQHVGSINVPEPRTQSWKFFIKRKVSNLDI